MPFQRKQKYRFDWHEQCHFELLIDASRFYEAMLQAIEQAEKFILFELYLIESGDVTRHFIEALIRARQRDVQVEIIFDDYGARLLDQLDREKLIAQGIELYFYNPLDYRHFYRSLRRDHRKLLLIDGLVAFIGGAGLSDAFQPPFSPELAWHDVMVSAEGPVVEDWITVFADTWENIAATPLSLPSYHTKKFHNGQLGRVTIAEGPRIQEINRSFIKRIRNAEHRIWLTTPYFIASRKIRRALIHRARAGIDVRILLPGPLSDHPWVSYAGRGFYSRLLRHGVRIFEYQPRFPHAKIELCDNWCSIGSSNLDRWNQRWNLDANQEINNSDFVRDLVEMFEQDFKQSIEIDFGQWQARSRWQRLREWLSGRIVTLLESIGRGYHR